jgi:hypothetical protein
MYLILTMNNTKNILLIAIISSILVLGTGVIPMQSYADRNNEDHKKTKDFVSSMKASSELAKESASQHQDQDNFCYRGNDCQQANEDQQIVGKDNEAKGFNDQSRNIQQQAVTPTQPPTPPPTPPPTQPQTTTPPQTQSPTPTTATLNICKTIYSQPSGATFQPSDFTFTFYDFPANPNTFQGANEGCTAVTVAPGPYVFAEVVPQSVNRFLVLIYGDCEFGPFFLDRVFFTGFIPEGETQTCTIRNAIID